MFSVSTKPSPGFTEDGPKKTTIHPVNSSCVDEERLGEVSEMVERP